MHLVDLHYECNELQNTDSALRITELAQKLPSVALFALGGFPIHRSIFHNEQFTWCCVSAVTGAFSLHIKEALGLAGVLTYCNKSNKTLLQLGNLSLDKGHLWAFHWVNLSFVFARHAPKVELAFARDTRFFLSWPVQQSPTGEVFAVTGSLKDWIRYTSHRHDTSFDADTRIAMQEVHEMISEILK